MWIQQGYGGWVYAKANVGPAYVGGSILYSSGDDGSDKSKIKDRSYQPGSQHRPDPRAR